jgi:hypothetical protein
MASKGRELLGSCRLLCKGEGRHNCGTRESRACIEPSSKKPNALFILGKIESQGNAHIRQEGFRCKKSLGYVFRQNSPTAR